MTATDHSDSSNPDFMSPEELEANVTAAQKNNQEAVQAKQNLYKAFYPMIRKEIRDPYVSDKLGEDAENTAWLIFFNYIATYHGTGRWKSLGKRLKVQVHKELRKVIKPWKRENARKAEESTEIISLEVGKEMGIECADILNNIDLIDAKISLIQFIHELPKQKQQFLVMYFINQTPIEECSKRLHLSMSNAYQWKSRLLRKINKIIGS